MNIESYNEQQATYRQIKQVIKQLAIEQNKIINTPSVVGTSEDNRMRKAYCLLDEQIETLHKAIKLLKDNS